MAVKIMDSDVDLGQEVYKDPYVSVKYHNDKFKVCQELFPQYLMLSNDPKYKDIKFIRIDADENLIAKKIIEKNAYSFMAIYKNGLLIESQTVSNREDIEKMLNQLLDAKNNS